MKDKVNTFIDNLQGQFVEVSYHKAIYQCMDLAYTWVFALDLPKATIQHLYAYEVWTNPRDVTKEHFHMIKNSPDAIPHAGDIIVWSKAYNGTAGHIGVATGEGDLNTFRVFEQNNPVGSKASVHTRSYFNVLGWLRPKVDMGSAKEDIVRGILIGLKGQTSDGEVSAWVDRYTNPEEMITEIVQNDGTFHELVVKPHLDRQKQQLENAHDSEKEEIIETWQSRITSANNIIEGLKKQLQQDKLTHIRSMSFWEFISLKFTRGGDTL